MDQDTDDVPVTAGGHVCPPVPLELLPQKQKHDATASDTRQQRKEKSHNLVNYASTSDPTEEEAAIVTLRAKESAAGTCGGPRQVAEAAAAVARISGGGDGAMLSSDSTSKAAELQEGLDDMGEHEQDDIGHVKRGPWSPEEDALLAALVRKHGSRWSQISKHIQGRPGKSCRLRWLNTLDPNVKKGDFSRAEDAQIIQAQLKFGNKWARIAASLESTRSDNAVKNHWNSSLKTRYPILETEGAQEFKEDVSKRGVAALLEEVRRADRIRRAAKALKPAGARSAAGGKTKGGQGQLDIGEMNNADSGCSKQRTSMKRARSYKDDGKDNASERQRAEETEPLFNKRRRLLSAHLCVQREEIDSAKSLKKVQPDELDSEHGKQQSLQNKTRTPSDQTKSASFSPLEDGTASKTQGGLLQSIENWRSALKNIIDATTTHNHSGSSSKSSREKHGEIDEKQKALPNCFLKLPLMGNSTSAGRNCFPRMQHPVGAADRSESDGARTITEAPPALLRGDVEEDCVMLETDPQQEAVGQTVGTPEVASQALSTAWNCDILTQALKAEEKLSVADEMSQVKTSEVFAKSREQIPLQGLPEIAEATSERNEEKDETAEAHSMEMSTVKMQHGRKFRAYGKPSWKNVNRSSSGARGVSPAMPRLRVDSLNSPSTQHATPLRTADASEGRAAHILKHDSADDALLEQVGRIVAAELRGLHSRAGDNHGAGCQDDGLSHQAGASGRMDKEMEVVVRVCLRLGQMMNPMVKH